MAAPDLTLYWGDMHTQFKPQWCPIEWPDFLEQSFVSARQYLDFFPIVYYPAVYYNTPEGLMVESVGWRDEYQAEWERINSLVKKYHEPGSFVTFSGYEWTGDRTRWGDHNVFYFADDQPLDLSMTIDELYANLRARRGIAVPHHSGYMPGARSKDWSHYDEDLSPFAEIYSGHGSSEGCNTVLKLDRNASMGPRVSGNTVQDGLARGCRVGIIASGDNGGGFAGKHGTGLMACYARELTREALWESFGKRRVYAVTGDRIGLEFMVNGAFMGDVVSSPGPAEVEVRAVGTQAIDRIELIRSNRVIATHCHNGSWHPPTAGRVRCKVQLECGWGPTPRYGFSVEEKVWRLRLKAEGARFVSAEGCFTRHGQTIGPLTEGECSFCLRTSPRGPGAAGPGCMQSVVVEIEGDVDAKVGLACDELSECFTLGELMERSRLLLLRRQMEDTVRAQFGLNAGEFENHEDVFFHNAYKIKIHQAIPSEGFTATLALTDDDVPPGRSFYYARVSQLNGQYAWSSPIWVDREG